VLKISDDKGNEDLDHLHIRNLRDPIFASSSASVANDPVYVAAW